MKKLKDLIYDTNDIIIALLILAVAALIIVWLCMSGWEPGKILGIIAAVLLILSMTLSYMDEEKRKSK